MEMIMISSGKLRAIGYGGRERILEVHLNDGTTLQYCGINEETWRRFRNSGSAWSFYRDNIEDEFTAKRSSGKAQGSKNSLDELFGKS